MQCLNKTILEWIALNSITPRIVCILFWLILLETNTPHIYMEYECYICQVICWLLEQKLVTNIPTPGMAPGAFIHMISVHGHLLQLVPPGGLWCVMKQSGGKYSNLFSSSFLTQIDFVWSFVTQFNQDFHNWKNLTWPKNLLHAIE